MSNKKPNGQGSIDQMILEGWRLTDRAAMLCDRIIASGKPMLLKWAIDPIAKTIDVVPDVQTDYVTQ